VLLPDDTLHDVKVYQHPDAPKSIKNFANFFADLACQSGLWKCFSVSNREP